MERLKKLKKIDLAEMVWTNLWRRKVRTVLTTTGVIIGTTAMVAMISIGVGMQKNLTEQLGSMGNITEISVMPKYEFSEGADIFAQLPDPVKKLDDAAIRDIRKIKGVAAATPQITIPGVELTYGAYRVNTTVTGVEPAEGEKFEVKMEAGRYFNRSDNKVILVGYKLPEKLQSKNKIKPKGLMIGKNPLENTSPQDKSVEAISGQKSSTEELSSIGILNKNVSLKFSGGSTQEETKTLNIKVVGIIDETGGQEDFSVIIPLKLASELVKWQNPGISKKGYDTVKVRVETPEMVEKAQEGIERLGFTFFSMKQMLAAVNNISKIVQIFLGGIGAIALLVACFGIINTMIMSIYERTREIGIMKVIGASITDIRQIFLLEAASIGFLGGVGGLIIAWSGTLIVNLLATTFLGKGQSVTLIYIPFWLAVFAICFATIIGLLSGIYPAMRAANISPLEAIRRE